VPCVAAAGSTKQRVEIYDPREGKKRKLDPYSANAKELYRLPHSSVSDSAPPPAWSSTSPSLDELTLIVPDRT
jgi:hypothetical protein